MKMPDTIYLDHNASTPVRPEVALAMQQALRDLGANPSSAHREGQRVRTAVEHAREQVAALLGARPDEVVFTSGGTEANNAALFGSAAARPDRTALLVSAVEHPSVSAPVQALRKAGHRLDIVPVDGNGAL